MMRMLSIMILAVILLGCTIKTEIIRTDEGYIINSKTDAIVTVEGEKVTVDNRGRPSLIEQLITMMFVNIDKEKINK